MRSTIRLSKARLFVPAFILALLCTLALTALLPQRAEATVLLDGTVPVPAAEAGSGPGIFDNRAYEESTVPYASVGRSYYFVTQDPAYEFVSTYSVSYGSSTFDCEVVYLAGGLFNSQSLRGAGGLLAGKPANANGITAFIDAGTYHNQSSANYTALSEDNLALIGLYTPTSGTPVVFTKADKGSGDIERYLINNTGMRYENLVIDAQGNRMHGNAWSGDSSRGRYLIHIPGKYVDFFMNNCSLTNLTTGSVFSNQSLAVFNVVHGHTGQVNLENISIDNVAINASYAYVQLNSTGSMNIRNVAITGPATTDALPLYNDYPTSATVGGVKASTVAVAGDFAVEGKTNRLAVKSLLAGSVAVPESYRYAVFTTASFSSTHSIMVYDSLDSFTLGNNEALFDLKDGTWMVRQPEGSGPTVETQLANINTILTRLAQPYPADTTSASTSQGRGYVSQAYVKLVASSAGTIGSFDVGALVPPIAAEPFFHIRAVPTTDILFTDTLDTTLVPLAMDAQVTIDPASSDLVRFYGIDFHGSDPDPANNPYYTLHEVHTGATTHVTDAVFQGSSAASFAACRFTGLVNDLAIVSPSTTPGPHTVELGDGPFTAQAEYANAYTCAATIIAKCDTAFAEDTAYTWSSSDPAIAEVDPVTGVVTPKAVGTATITATALDTQNHGEIERPSASFELIVADTQPVVPPVDPTPGPTDDPKPLPTPVSSADPVLARVGDAVLPLAALGMLVILGAGGLLLSRARQN